MKYLTNVLNFLKTVPGKIVFWVLIGGTVVAIVLQFLGKLTVLKAKDMNLAALINDAVRNLKIKQNDEKIKEAKKDPVTKKNPKDVEEFYKKELK